MGQFDEHNLEYDLHNEIRHLPQVGCTISLFDCGERCSRAALCSMPADAMSGEILRTRSLIS
jgi:hypothetical protein